MKVTTEMVETFITDGAASAIQSAKGKASKIAGQMNAELMGNESHTSANTIEMKIVIKLDAESRKVEIEGGFGFKVPNISDKAPKIIRDLPHPDQGDLPFDGVTPKPADDGEMSEVEV